MRGVQDWTVSTEIAQRSCPDSGSNTWAGTRPKVTSCQPSVSTVASPSDSASFSSGVPGGCILPSSHRPAAMTGMFRLVRVSTASAKAASASSAEEKLRSNVMDAAPASASRVSSSG